MSWGLDARYALRPIVRTPVVSAVVLLTLALGIGANTAIFAIVNGLLLRPLPYPHQERLVFLNETAPKRGFLRVQLSYPDYEDWRARQHVFDAMALYRHDELALTGGGEAEQVEGAEVTASLFDVLGVRPVAGRALRPDEGAPGGEPVAVVSERLWRRRFGGGPFLEGRSIVLDGRRRTVVGVMPPTFTFPASADVWVPFDQPIDDSRSDHWLSAVARLAPGASLEHARREIGDIAADLGRTHPDTNADVGVLMHSLREEAVGEYRLAFLALMGAVGFVLLIACANIANLMLARLAGREREMAVRVALGASRWRVARPLVAEALWFALAGGALGLVAGWGGKDLLVAAIPAELGVPAWVTFDVDSTVYLFSLVASLVSAAVFGLAPILQASRPDLREGLAGGDLRATARRGRLGGAGIVAEVALALVLLAGGGLMTRGFLRLQAVDPGFDTSHALVAMVRLPSARYGDDGARRRFVREVLDRLAALPGVTHAAEASNLPLIGGANASSFTAEGAPPSAPGQLPVANLVIATPGYFQTMGIPMVHGRTFTDADGPDAPPVVIVNELLARRYWPDSDPVGKRIRFGDNDPTEPWTTVVGVVGNIRHDSLAAPLRPGVYVPYAQLPHGNVRLVVRTAGDPLALAAPVRAAIWALDPDLPVVDEMTLARVVARSVWQSRLYSWLFGIFGGVALLLAATGVYGVVAYAVSRRTREIGIRMALGASRRDVGRLIVGQGARLAALGLALGLAAAYALTPVLASLLFGVAATDPATFAGATAGLLAVALGAAWLPARRAARLDPAVALRAE